MDGVFKKKKGDMVSNIIMIFSGISLILLFGFIWIVDEEAAIDDDSVFLVVLGIICICIGVFSGLFNYKAYLHIENNHISARFNWNRRLECGFEKIKSVYCQKDTLTIETNKSYVILGLKNAYDLCLFIRKNLENSDEITDMETIIEEIVTIQGKRKKEVMIVCGCAILMGIGFFVPMVLTGDKEFFEFSRSDWILTATMGLFGIIFLVIMFVVAVPAGEKARYIIGLEDKLRRVIMKNTAVSRKGSIFVYTDIESFWRMIVFGDFENAGVYYIVEAINRNYEVEIIYTSEIFWKMEDLKMEIEDSEWFDALEELEKGAENGFRSFA